MLWTDKATKYLKKYWNLDELKPKQVEVINELLLGNDVIGLLPTGFGKSMCYLIPPLVTRKVMIIISPLISLMDDQKNNLLKKGLSCSALHCNNKNKDEETFNIIDGNIKIVYMSPEYLVKGNGKELVNILIENNRLGFVAVDEAHCISSWSHDFRPEYKFIGEFRKSFPDINIPIVAVTATATDYVCEDIKACIGLINPKVVKASFDRPNLYIKICDIPTEPVIVKKKTVEKPVDKAEIVQSYIDKYKGHKIIIYINSRSDTAELSNDINRNNKDISEAYHAGLTPKVRDKIHAKFASGEINVIVSTIAFGMGIDQIVKCVIIFGCSSSIEENIQQCGRAGRDGLPAETIFYFDKKQFMIKKHLTNKIKTRYPQLCKIKLDNLSKVWNLVYTTTCKRKYILEYFNESTNYITCNNCDNCCERKLVDMTIPFSEILLKESLMTKAVNEIKQKYVCNELTNLLSILWKWKNYIISNKLDIKKLDKTLLLRFQDYCIIKPKPVKLVEPKESIDDKLDKYSKLACI